MLTLTDRLALALASLAGIGAACSLAGYAFTAASVFDRLRGLLAL